MDRLLSYVVTRGLRRGLGGEPAWLALGVAAWLVRRARRRGPEVLWSGRLQAGDRLVLSSWVPSQEPRPAPPP